MTHATPSTIEDLWKQLAGRLHAFFRARTDSPEDAEDLLQECFLRVHRGLGGLADDERVLGWVYRIAHNLVADHRRRRRAAEPLSAETAAESHEQPAAVLVASWLAPLIDSLPDTYRDVLRASEIEEQKYREIAARFGLSLAAVKSRVRRGRMLLRERLEACCAFEFDRRGALTGWQRRAAKPCACDDSSPPATDPRP